MRSLKLLLALALASTALACSGTADDGSLAEDADEALTGTKVLPDDLSVLYPMPKLHHEDDLVAPTAKGARGALLPAAFAAKLPVLAQGATVDMLRVVSFRVDPCFPVEGASDAKGCKNELRLVLQPVHADADGKALTTDDAAVHLFYEITRDELTTMTKELLDLRKANGGHRTKALTVHPILTRQGLGGNFATGLETFVLAHAGEKNLIRMTFMTRTNSRETQWKFGAFDVKGGKLASSPIATLGQTLEQTVSNAGFGAAPAFAVTPMTTSKEDVSLLFRASDAQGARKADRQAAFDVALRIENPTMHSPNTIDCASCHLATPARNYAETLDVARTSNPNRFTGTKLSLTNTAQGLVGSNNIRAFGYLGTQPAISQRTVNEAAAATDYVNTKILAAK